MMTYKLKNIVTRVCLYVVLIGFGIVMVFPLIWLIRSSLMTQREIFGMPFKWLPERVMWSNYGKALTMVPFFLYLKNTLFLVCTNLIGAIVSNSFIAFGFARIQFKTRNFWFSIVLLTMMIPWSVMLIPQFIGWKMIGAYNTYFPLTVPAFFGSAFFIFLMRQFYMTIPRDYDEAAYIDGANYLQVYLKVILPLSRPALTVIGVFTFMGIWNDFFGPLIYLSDSNKWNLSLGLTSFVGQYNSNWELLMAFSTVTFLPMAIVFFFAQKAFIQGVSITGVKG
jgi:multiple sugar transport system permease protein